MQAATGSPMHDKPLEVERGHTSLESHLICICNVTGENFIFRDYKACNVHFRFGLNNGGRIFVLGLSI